MSQNSVVPSCKLQSNENKTYSDGNVSLTRLTGVHIEYKHTYSRNIIIIIIINLFSIALLKNKVYKVL